MKSELACLSQVLKINVQKNLGNKSERFLFCSLMCSVTKQSVTPKKLFYCAASQSTSLGHSLLNPETVVCDKKLTGKKFGWYKNSVGEIQKF